jgi:hypothetical protein
VIRVYDAAGNGSVGAIHDSSASREERGTIERYGKRFIVHADEMLTAFVELERGDTRVGREFDLVMPCRSVREMKS